MQQFKAEQARRMREHYDRQANGSALFFVGLIALIGLWLWAEMGFPT
jgi:hypothetical protein